MLGHPSRCLGDLPPQVAEQLHAVAAVARRRNLHTIVLTDPLTLSWFTGARWHVQHTLHKSSFDLVISDLDTDRPRIQAIASVVEAERLAEVEFAGMTPVIETIAVPWTTNREAALPTGSGVGSDRALPGTASIAPDLTRLRRRLTAHQREALAELTLDASTLLGNIARSVTPGMRERVIAAQVTAALVAGGMDVLLCLVGTDERLVRHKHPLPSDERFRERLMISVAVRRRGVCSSVTRFVSANRLDDHDRAIYRRLLVVEDAMLAASRAGESLRAPIDAAIGSYGEAGLSPDGWMHHHQGGIAGFAPREVIATPESSESLEESMVVAWNPSASGWKVEGVAVVGEAGARLVPEDPSWPTIGCNGRLRPAILEL